MSGFSKRHGSSVKLLEVFEMTRNGEAVQYAQHDAKEGRTLLWHGTNIAVAAAICSSGMRIMPNSGGRVGKGIYLANQSVKSGHYVQPAADGTGIMFLAEAAMGTPSCILRDDPHLTKAPAGAITWVIIARTRRPYNRSI
jgi:poly [ADP-ribose] polymerase